MTALWANVVPGRAGAAPAAAASNAAGTAGSPRHGVPPSFRVRFGLLLRYRHADELAQLVALQGDRQSPLFGRYLSAAQWNAYFAPDAASVARVARTLGPSFHFDATRLHEGLLIGSAAASSVEAAFGTSLGLVEGRAGSRIVAARSPVVPSGLAGAVASIAGLDGVTFAPIGGIARPRHIPASAVAVKPATYPTPKPNPNPEQPLPVGPQYIHGKGGGLGPAAVAVAYDYPVQHGYAGRSRTVGNVVGVDYQDSDLAAFFTEFGITPGGSITRVSIDGGPGTGAAGQLEATTDVEAILGTAPNANYVEYLVPVLDELEIENAYAAALAANTVDVLNSSFGVCEAQDPAAEYDFDQLALQGNAKGITFVAATGDGGSTECPGPNGQSTQQGIDVPAAAYHFTGLGATDLQVDPVTGAYVAETASPTSGGGYSEFLAEPTWQKQIGGIDAAGRNVPDLSLLGGSASGYDIVINGVDLPSSGTSVASALFCGYLAEFDEIRKRRNGWLNPRLYKALLNQAYAFAYRDVTAGSNGLFTAGQGYDDVSGIGSILGWELAGTL